MRHIKAVTIMKAQDGDGDGSNFFNRLFNFIDCIFTGGSNCKENFKGDDNSAT